MEAPPPSHLATSLWHIGWAGVDGPSEFEWRAKAGIEVQTPLFSWNLIRVDNVNLIVFGAPGPGDPRPEWLPDQVGDEFVPTDGTAIDHIAFSYADITPVYERMRGTGVEIVRPIATDPEHGLTSFFVRAPDRLLVEIVQEKPVPDGIWN